MLGAAFLFVARYRPARREAFAPFVSVIVPVYNEAKVLRDSVRSLLELDYGNYEIIIVNDGSNDATTEVGQALAGYHDGLRSRVRVVLIDKPNGGKASALNAGIQYSRAEFVLCMDGDSQLAPDTITVAVRHFADPAVGAVAGNVKVLNRRRILSRLQALVARSERRTHSVYSDTIRSGGSASTIFIVVLTFLNSNFSIVKVPMVPVTSISTLGRANPAFLAPVAPCVPFDAEGPAGRSGSGEEALQAPPARRHGGDAIERAWARSVLCYGVSSGRRVIAISCWRASPVAACAARRFGPCPLAHQYS